MLCPALCTHSRALHWPWSPACTHALPPLQGSPQAPACTLLRPETPWKRAGKASGLCCLLHPDGTLLHTVVRRSRAGKRLPAPGGCDDEGTHRLSSYVLYKGYRKRHANNNNKYMCTHGLDRQGRPRPQGGPHARACALQPPPKRVAEPPTIPPRPIRSQRGGALWPLRPLAPNAPSHCSSSQPLTPLGPGGPPTDGARRRGAGARHPLLWIMDLIPVTDRVSKR